MQQHELFQFPHLLLLIHPHKLAAFFAIVEIAKFMDCLPGCLWLDVVRCILVDSGEVYFWVTHKRTDPPFAINFLNGEDQLVLVVFLMLMDLNHPETIEEIDRFLPYFVKKWRFIDPDAEMGGAELHLQVLLLDVPADAEGYCQILIQG